MLSRIWDSRRSKSSSFSKIYFLTYLNYLKSKSSICNNAKLCKRMQNSMKFVVVHEFYNRVLRRTSDIKCLHAQLRLSLCKIRIECLDAQFI